MRIDKKFVTINLILYIHIVNSSFNSFKGELSDAFDFLLGNMKNKFSNKNIVLTNILPNQYDKMWMCRFFVAAKKNFKLSFSQIRLKAGTVKWSVWYTKDIHV